MTLDEMRSRADRLRDELKDATYRNNRDPSPFQLADIVQDMLVLVTALVERAPPTASDCEAGADETEQRPVLDDEWFENAAAYHGETLIRAEGGPASQERRTEGTLEDLAKRILGATCCCYADAWPAASCAETVQQVVALLAEAEHRPPPTIHLIMEGMVLVHGRPMSIGAIEALIPREAMRT